LKTIPGIIEGIISSGYGAGTVIVWDEGTYEPIERKKIKKGNEKLLLHHYTKALFLLC